MQKVISLLASGLDLGLGAFSEMGTPDGRYGEFTRLCFLVLSDSGSCFGILWFEDHILF